MKELVEKSSTKMQMLRLKMVTKLQELVPVKLHWKSKKQ